MALLSASDFIGYSDGFAAPADFNGPIFAGSVDLILSTGITQQVFDTLPTAAQCIHFLLTQKNLIVTKMLLLLISGLNV